MRDDRGGLVLGWLAKVAVFLLVLGAIAFEGGAVVVARVGVDGTADTAARDAASTFGTSHDAQRARDQADRDAAQAGSHVTAFSVSDDGKTVTVTVERTARTFFIQHIGPLKKFRTARSTHTASVT